MTSAKKPLIIYPSKDEFTENIVSNFASGILAGVKITLGMVVYAGLIFNYSGNSTLRMAYPVGINILLLSAILSGVVNTIFSHFAISFASPQDTSSVLLALMSSALVSSTAADKLVTTLLYLQAICTLSCAVVFLASGYFNLTKLVQYIPFPIMAGFLGVIGVQTVVSALSLASGVRFIYIWPSDFVKFFTPTPIAQTICCVSFSVGLMYIPGYLKAKLKDYVPSFVNNLWGITYILSTPFLFYIIVTAAGISSTELRQYGWLNEVGISSPWLETWNNFDINDADFSAVASMAPNIVILVLLVWISALLNVNGLELGLKDTGVCDKNREIVSLGLCNLICGVVGGAPIFHQLGTTIQGRNTGSTNRMAGVSCTLVCLVIFLTDAPTAIQKVIPDFFLAGIFFTVGIDFLDTWVVKTQRRLRAIEYSLILATVMTSICTSESQYSILIAIVVGSVLAIILFLYEMSGGVSAQQKFSGKSTASRVQRSATEKRILHSLGGRTLIIKFTGVIFFGSIESVIGLVLRALAPEKDVPRQPCEYVIIDFGGTLSMDASSAEALKRLRFIVEECGAILIVCSMKPRQVEVVRKIGFLPEEVVAKLAPADKKCPAGVHSHTEFCMICNWGFSPQDFDESKLRLMETIEEGDEDTEEDSNEEDVSAQSNKSLNISSPLHSSQGVEMTELSSSSIAIDVLADAALGAQNFRSNGKEVTCDINGCGGGGDAVAAEDLSVFTFFDNQDLALEWCENDLLERFVYGFIESKDLTPESPEMSSNQEESGGLQVGRYSLDIRSTTVSSGTVRLRSEPCCKPGVRGLAAQIKALRRVAGVDVSDAEGMDVPQVGASTNIAAPRRRSVKELFGGRTFASGSDEEFSFLYGVPLSLKRHCQEVKNLPPGHVILEAGTKYRSLILVRRGVVDCVAAESDRSYQQVSPNGRVPPPERIFRHGAGALLNLASFLQPTTLPSPHTFKVAQVASTETKLGEVVLKVDTTATIWVLDKTRFDRLVVEDPATLAALLHYGITSQTQSSSKNSLHHKTSHGIKSSNHASR